MGKKYQKRVGELIRRKVAQLLLTESQDPRLTPVTITDVTVNRDTTRASIYYSLIGTPEEKMAVQNALDGAAGWMRAQLAPSLRLRNVPHFQFIYDPSLEYGDRIDALLERVGTGAHDDQSGVSTAGCSSAEEA